MKDNTSKKQYWIKYILYSSFIYIYVSANVLDIYVSNISFYLFLLCIITCIIAS